MQMHSTYEIHCNLWHVLESKTYTACSFRGFLFRRYSVWLMGIMFTGPARRGKKPEKAFERLNRPWKDCIVLLPYLWWASFCSGAKLLETQYESCDTYCVLAYKSGEWTATTTHLSSMKPNMQQFAFRLSVLTFPFFFVRCDLGDPTTLHNRILRTFWWWAKMLDPRYLVQMGRRQVTVLWRPANSNLYSYLILLGLITLCLSAGVIVLRRKDASLVSYNFALNSWSPAVTEDLERRAFHGILGALAWKVRGQLEKYC